MKDLNNIVVGTKIKKKYYEFIPTEGAKPEEIVQHEEKYVFGEVERVIDDVLVEIRFYDPRFANEIMKKETLILL